VETSSKFCLWPVTLGAKNAKPVFHGALNRIGWHQCVCAGNELR
jgi:hypothetical protein